MNDICAYCNEPIGNKKSIYKYFRDDGMHKLVHFHHLQVKKGESDADKKDAGKASGEKSSGVEKKPIRIKVIDKDDSISGAHKRFRNQEIQESESE